MWTHITTKLVIILNRTWEHGTMEYNTTDVYVCTYSWWWICALRRVQLMCQQIFLWHAHGQNLPSMFAYMIVNMWMRYNQFYSVGTCSYDVYVCTCSRWWIYTLRGVQLMCQKLFLWHVHYQKFTFIFPYMYVNMWMHCTEFYCVGTCSYDV